MRKYKQRFIWRNFFYSNFTIIIIIIFIFFISKSIFKIYRKYEMTKEDAVFVEKEKKESENKMDLSQIKLDNIKTEEGKEKYIRETYPVQKQGEELIVVYTNQASTYEIPKSESRWSQIKAFFRDLFIKDN